MDEASSARASWSIFVRGWYFPGRMRPTGSVVSASRGGSSPPSSASSPRPSPFCLIMTIPFALCRSGQCAFAARQNFLCQRDVGLGALRGLVPNDGRHAVARRLGESHVAGHERLIDLVPEVRFQLLRYL